MAEIKRKFPILTEHRKYPENHNHEIFKRFRILWKSTDIIKRYNNIIKDPKTLDFLPAKPRTRRRAVIMKFKELVGDTYDLFSDGNFIKCYKSYNLHINRIIRANKKIKERNLIISDLIEKIKNLENWSDYIIFEGAKYGLPPILKCIHRENDCLGKILISENGSTNRRIAYTFTCLKCSFTKVVNKLVELNL